MRARTVYELPAPVTGYPLETLDLSVVKPKAAQNIIANPSVETDTTGYAGLTGTETLARVTTQQRRGVYGLQISGGTAGGASYGNVSLVAGALYFFSLDVKGVAGVLYRLGFRANNGATISGATDYDFRGTGRWQRLFVPYQETTTVTRRLVIRQVSGATRTFFVDGLQCEAGELTTYLDGSLTGFVRGQAAYYWIGAEHASQSVRVLSTRSGGVEMKLRDLGFYVTALLGMGLNGVSNITLPNAYTGGSQYQRTIQTEYTFDVVGSFMADSPLELMRQRRDLEAALRPNAGILQQPLLLKAQVTDDCGVAVGEPMAIECLYAGGLQANRDNYYQEQAVLTFTVFLPFLASLDGNAGATLAHESTFTAAYHAANIDGDWQQLSTGFDSPVMTIAVDEQRGRIYYGGLFTTAGGITVNGICYWNISTQTFVAMDGGVGGALPFLNMIMLDANGNVWIGGSFSTVGSGAAATTGIARWNVAAGTWTAFNISTAGANPTITDIAISDDGDVYLGGGFLEWDGDGDANNIVVYDGSTWEPVGTGANDFVLALEWSNGYLYAGGAFTAMGGVANTSRIARWNKVSTVWLAMPPASVNDDVRALAAMPDGTILIGGEFTQIGPLDVFGFAVWNGTTLLDLGGGVAGDVYRINVLSDGTALVAGNFTAAGELVTADRVAIWNGSTFLPLDIDLPGTPIVRAAANLRGDLYLGFDTSGSATIGGLTTITNPGSADAYPKILMTGPGRVDKLKSYTTGDLLAFNLALLAGEQAVLDLTPNNIRLYSNFRPNLLGTILPGSTLATFRLAPGENALRFYIADDDTATAATLQFQPSYFSLDDSLYD